MAFDSDDREKIAERTKTANQPYRLQLAEPPSEEFSFLVVGDTGAGDQLEVAKILDQHLDNADFVLHVGDVIYPNGSAKDYPAKFIKPYHSMLQDNPTKHNEMVFKVPFFPVYGNHDYYGSTWLLKAGSQNGKVFEEAFVAKDGATDQEQPLLYDPGAGQTRVPNRYYWFTYGKCAFFALDSNTLDTFADRSTADLGDDEYKEELKLRKEELKETAEEWEERIEAYERTCEKHNAAPDSEKVVAEIGEELAGELLEVEKDLRMLEVAEKSDLSNYDKVQIDWLTDQLRRPELADHWKVVFLHHPLYTSEARHMDDPELIGLRANLATLFADAGVNLVLAGHSHCFEWLRSKNKAEKLITHIVSGGGGKTLRKSILEDRRLHDRRFLGMGTRFLKLAESLAYSARGHKVFGEDDEVSKLYHFLRIDVKTDRLEVRPIGVGKQGGEYVTFSAGMPVKSLDNSPGVPDKLKVKHWLLDRINVYKDRPSEAPRMEE